MKKIINKETLSNGVIVLTMNNPEVNNNITWKAAEDLYLEIKSSRENGSNIFILASSLNSKFTLCRDFKFEIRRNFANLNSKFVIPTDSLLRRYCNNI